MKMLFLNFFLYAVLVTSSVSCSKKNSDSGGGTNPVDTTETYVTKTAVNGIRIAWDYSTLKKIAPASGVSANYCGYSRLIRRYDNSLYCVYERDGNIEGTKSIDGGATWQQPVLIAAKNGDIEMAAPDILELNDRSLLVSFNPRPPATNTDISKRYAIKTIKSNDGGATWINERLLYQASHLFQDGCWEPSQIQLPSGEIHLYFSNEGIYTNTDEQNISLLRSSDGGLSWTASPLMVAFRAGRRDGMPSPVILQNNEIVFSIEDNANVTFKPYIIRNSINNNWASGAVDGGSANRNYALAEQLDAQVYAGAPYLRQLATGETLLSYQSTEGRSNSLLENSRMIVAIGNNTAKEFSRRTEPFNIQSGKNGVWNSLAVVNDTVYAITSTNSFAAGTEVRMIKGYVIPELKVSSSTITVDGNLNETGWPSKFPVFIGHKGQAQLQAALSYSSDYLYVAAKVKDNNIVNESASVSDDDAIIFCVDAKNKSAEALTKTIYKFTVGADGRLNVKEGSRGAWLEYTGSIAGIIKSVQKTSSVYTIEMAIPWSFIGGKPAAGNRFGVTMGLINDDNGGLPEYTDGISYNLETAPYTWCPASLQ
jgi:Carbohydrate family 9 binding domain-like